MSPTCWIIAGPNGAGKTTFALDYLPQVAGRPRSDRDIHETCYQLLLAEAQR
ncbi:MAG: hypothetical protein AMXMBFR26_03170 [Porticoccaceae bacterium]